MKTGERSIVEAANIITQLPHELLEQVVKTNQHEDKKYYYAHNTGHHRIIWILLEPIERLVGTNIAVTIETTYISKKVVLPKHAGRKHLVVRMTERANPMWDPRDIDVIIDLAPRDKTPGRRPIDDESTIIKAFVPRSMAEIFKEAGDGNISKGVRIAGEYLRGRFRSDLSFAPLATILVGEIFRWCQDCRIWF